MSDTPAPDSNPLKPVVTKAIHDLKTPISCIRTTAEILRLTAGNPEQQAKALKMIDTQVDEMNSILEKLRASLQ